MKVWIRPLAIGLISVATGCRGVRGNDHAAELNHARQQAALTGVAQTVLYRDADGSTVTTLVQPPQPGDPAEQITVTRTPR